MPTTILGAVNEMLEAIGLPAVDQLDTGGTSEEAEAENMLARINRDIQGQGWHCNTIRESFTPNGSNEIPLTDVLRVVKPVGFSAAESVAMRDGQLYDVANNTEKFDRDIELEIVYLLDFESLSEKMRSYITAEARVRFQRFKKRGQVDDQFAQDEMLRARVEARQEDSDLRRLNVLQTDEARRVKGSRNSIYTRRSH